LWYWEESPFNIINTTFSGNEAAERGGAIYNAQWGSETNIVNTTFANNSAGSESGAIYTANTRPVTVTNSIFDSNRAGDGSNPNQQTNRELTGGNNLQSPDSGNNVTENITIVDPLLGALQDINGVFLHPLLPGSPAIDAGTSVGAPGTDQTGAVRPQDGDLNGSALVDLGAYESPGTLLTPEIQVLEGNTDIADGSTVALDFGSTSVGSTLSKTFTIQNLGTAILTLEAPGLPEDFSIVGDFPSTVAAGDSASLTLALDTTIAGTYSGTISFGNNDSDESPFDFTISGTVDSPPVLNPINGTDLSETLIGTAEDDRIDGFGGQDLISGNLGNDQLFGGAGHDRIWGRRGDDLLYGGEGHDQLNGGADQDRLWGEADNDQLCGNLGDDWLNGGLGNDTLTGGGGRDTFVLAAGHGNDLIRDFQLGEDSIGLAEGLSFEQLSLRQKHSQTWVVDTEQGELLARLDGVDATLLTNQAATSFVLM
jgi:predicted outer membrane repeat protein